MKKYLFIILTLCLICVSAAGCSKNEASQSDGGKYETHGISAVNGGVDNNSAKARKKPSAGGTVDVDLTVLSGTMVYAEVYNIILKPKKYIGKTIKIRGPYYAVNYNYGGTGRYYHYVIIEDAAACCRQGFEFIWNGEHAYPGDYPEDQTKIEVIGVFDSYDELGQTYYYLAIDHLSIL